MSARRLLLTLLLLLLPAAARAQDLKDRFNIRVSLTGMYEKEQELSVALPMGVTPEQAAVASPYSLGYGDLRATIDGRRLPGNWELHIDGRVRITGQYDQSVMDVGGSQVTARGYLGGREYDLYQAWARRRGEQWDFGIGRMVVGEADALKIDGARLWYRPAKHWDVTAYAGAYPDPYSRSLTSDYTAGFAFAGGLSSAYTYDKIWGSLSANGAYLGGKTDGGAVVIDPTTMSFEAPKVRNEPPRVWITWTDYIRVVSWLDVFTDVVFDAVSDAGPQLTRLDALVTARAGSHLTLHAGYDHLSSFAIEMWLNRLLADRTMQAANTIENNLLVDRTARDEGRLQADLAFGKFSIDADGRLRKRAIVSLSDDPQFVQTGKLVAPGVAYDVTLGLHDRGSLAGFREGLWATYLSDYRARSILAGIDLGRSFWDEKLGIDLAFLYARTNDDEKGARVLGAPVTCNTMSITTINATCEGARSGAEYELGLTLSGQPFNHWYAFVDYRLVADTTDGGRVAGTAAMGTTAATAATALEPTVLTHVLLLRIEARY